MAIKGRSKPRARRAVTPGPRPTYVPVKKPLLARRGFQIGTLVVIFVVAVGGIWYGLAKERAQQRHADFERALRLAVTRYVGQVQHILDGVGQPTAGGYSVLPTLKTDIDGLTKGTVKAATAVKDAATLVTQAKTAADAIDAIDVTALITNKGFGQTFAGYMVNSKASFGYALKLYEQSANLLQMAAGARGDLRTQLLASAKSLLDEANGLFGEGYNDYVNAQVIAKIYHPSQAVPPLGTGS